MITKSELDRITGYLKTGQSKAALKICKAGMKRSPKEAAFAHLAGTALSQAGQPREGAQYFMKALKLAPGNRASQDNLVNALVQSEQFDKARKLINTLLAERKRDPMLSYQLGALEFQSLNPNAAEAALTDCIDALQGTRDPTLRNTLMRAYALRGRHHELTWDNTAARNDFAAALQIAPNNPGIMANYAGCLAVELKNDAAIELLEKALAINPNSVRALMQYGNTLNQIARRSEAIEIFGKVLQREPQHAGALLQLSYASGNDEYEESARALKTAFQKTATGSYEQGQIAFALARTHEKAGARDEANTWYAKANGIVSSVRAYEPEKSQARFDRHRALFAAPPFPKGEIDPNAARPIFVIGQPRSGTTLTEMTLSAHPDIAGVGEQSIAGALANAYLTGKKTYDADAATAFARQYREELPDLPEGAKYFVDKMPGNYQNVGFLLTAFPNAVILNISRDPRDVAWSMWRVMFPALGLNYTFDMAAMAQEANLYRRYIEHWKSVFPGRIHDVHYEELVADIEGQSRRMAELCETNWVEEMARPDKNKAPVRTASIHQVRQKVSTKSVGGWRSHEEIFVPFHENLDPDLWPGLG